MLKRYFQNFFKERKSLLLNNQRKEYGAATEQEKLCKEKKHKLPKGVPLRKLFQYATSLDGCLMFFGSLFAIVHGAGMPVMAIVFGGMTQKFIHHTQAAFLGPGSNMSNTLGLDNASFSFYNSTSTSTQSTTAGDHMGNSFDAIPPQQLNNIMSTYSLYYIYIALAVMTTSYLQSVCWCVTCERQIHRLREEFFYQVLRQEIRWFDARQSGALAMKLNDDMERVREGIGDKFSMLIQSLSTFFTGFVIGFNSSWRLTLVIMALTPLLVICSSFTAQIIAMSAAREQQKYAVAGSIAEEALSCIKTVISFCGQKHELDRYSKVLQQGTDIAIRKIYILGVVFGLTFFILYGSYALAFWYASQLLLEDQIIAGNAFTVFFAVMIGSSSLGTALPYLTAIAVARGSARSIFGIIDSQPEIDAYSKEGMQLGNFTANIQLNNISFNYPARPGVKVLRNLSLNIQEGQTIALCGHSGSGKSTIVNLLLRFYDPSSGNITLGGVDIRDVNVRWLRTIIGIVSQEPILFDCSITENIQYGNENVSFQKIVEAAKNANAHDFISGLPCGYDTIVGERGAQLSGGQKQRIAIARALVRDPKILLLDEATSALDAESESFVQEALDKARQGRTTIIVAHRLSTIKNADMIYAMANGEIVEQGTHRELMDQEGFYYQLITHQIYVNDTGYSTTENVSASESTRQTEHRRSRNTHKDRNINKLAEDLQKVFLPVHLATTLTNEKPSPRKLSRQMFRMDNYKYFGTPVQEDNTPPEPVETNNLRENVEMPSAFKLFQAARPEWLLFFIGCLGAIGTGGIMPTFAIFYSEIFDTFTMTGKDLENAAFFWSMMFIVLAVVASISNYIRPVNFGIAGEKLTTRLRANAFGNILRQHAGWFDIEEHSSGKLSTRLATDGPMVKSATGSRLGMIVASIASLVSSLTIAYVCGWKLALALTAVLPVLIATGSMNTRKKKGNQKRDAELMADASKVVTQGIENIRTVQALTLEPTFIAKFLLNLMLPYRESRKNALFTSIATSFADGMIYFLYAGAFRLGAFFVSNGDMKTVDVYRVIFALAFSAVWLGQFTTYFPDYAKAKLSAGMIFNLIEKEPEIDSLSPNGLKAPIKGEITISELHFRYPNRSDAPVLRGINLNVQPGRTLALVGPSGCGKSTVISLVQRFYDPEEGKVKVDDFDIRTLNLMYLRRHVAVVSQEPVLFNCSIRDNITYGLEETVPQDHVETAARNANVHDFIKSLPQGYATLVGEKGTQLSGGQKQRIAIARALVRNPKILLLDEATSALDTESEKLVQDAIDKARKGRTCIVIAHRLSTIQSADCISIIDRGGVVEQGTHEELIWKKGAYHQLIKRQRIKH